MRETTSVDRRRALRTGLGLAAFAVSGTVRTRANARAAEPGPRPDGRIREIQGQVIFPGRQTGVTWFHPRPCMIPGAHGTRALMTLQTVSGSDVFGPVHWTMSPDQGHTWSPPEPIPGMGRTDLGDDEQVGVCDVVPEYHPPSRTVLAMGHNVYYRRGVLANPQGRRWPVYTVRTADGRWSAVQRLEWEDPRATAIYTCGCSQRVVLDDGDILVPLSIGREGRVPRSVLTVRCRFDGRTLRVAEVGGELTLDVGRGLLEPSLTRLEGRTYLTIRAEDGRGYVATSDDGLRWSPQRPWCWDDGQPLEMSTTQQHWLPHSEALFLVYTRKAEANANLFRWRAPLYVAEVDRTTLRLIRSTERIVLPMIGDGIHEPDRVALMGNFHTVAASADESWVTVGENLSKQGWRGDTLLARIRWERPSRTTNM